MAVWLGGYTSRKKTIEKESCSYEKRILEIELKKLERNIDKKDSVIKKLNRKSYKM